MPQNPSDNIHNVKNVDIQILIGNIIDQNCDAIVNAANIYLQNGSGVCGAIFSGAGSRLKEACDEQIHALGRNLDVTEAVVTEGFDLSHQCCDLIHIVMCCRDGLLWLKACLLSPSVLHLAFGAVHGVRE